ncbi:MAG: TrmH family RNA methyltransferase [Acidimicrobiales bacterium]
MARGPTRCLRAPEGAKDRDGTDRYVDWAVVATTGEALRQAVDAGFRPVGIELVPSAVPLFALDLRTDVALVVGHEERGLSKVALERCSAFAFAPQVGKVGSLNVAAATAIALYEARRQEWTAAPPSPG